MPDKTALVISAHAADFVWRCGGAIALHASKGYRVTVVCLSFGERGESARLWKEPGMTLDKVKAARRGEAEEAARALGVHDLQCFDLGDYPLRLTDGDKYRLVDVIRAVQPAFMLSHSGCFWNTWRGSFQRSSPGIRARYATSHACTSRRCCPARGLCAC